MSKLILPAIHLALLVGFIAYKTKTPFGEFIRNRHREILEGLNKSKRQAAEAEAKKKEVEAKFASLELEKQKILADWKEREAFQLKSVQDTSARILAQMKKESEQNKKALEEFYRSAAIKSMGQAVMAQAEAKIRQGLNSGTHQKINERFASELGA